MSNGELIDFIRESNRIEGITRDPSDREVDAHQRFLGLTEITALDLENFVAEVAQAELRCREGMDVRVGNHIAPPGGPEIVDALEHILANMATAGPYRTHCHYETLHPFMDGNGRSGRVLWLWQMGGEAPLGFLHRFYYQTLEAWRE